MFIKNGDLQPIVVIEPDLIDGQHAKEQLETVLDDVKKSAEKIENTKDVNVN
jgi:hypothetical protein